MTGEASSTTRRSRLAHVHLLLACMIAVSIGCSERLYSDYGYSHSWLGRRSINGTAALREMYEAKGWETIKLNRLGYHAGQVDAIVWFPAVPQTPKGTTTQWFDEWLSDSPRTLVFVCRGIDHGERQYWQLAARHAPPKDRLEYRRRAARDETVWASMGSTRKATSWTNGWFTVDARAEYSESDQFNGPWAKDLKSPLKPMSTRVVIRPFDPAKDGQLETGPRPEGALTLKQQKAKFESLLETNTGEILAARVTSDRWPDSQVIVISSGQSVVNLALIEAQNRVLAHQLVSETRPLGTAGFMRTDWAGARIANAEDEPLAAGMELLTTWPLSMATMHAVLMGFVVCLILLPIFGRPRRLPKRSTGDFSAHVSAVADLMHRSGDDAYARERISEYFLRVRDDSENRWVIAKASNAAPMKVLKANTNPKPDSENTIQDAAPNLDAVAMPSPEERES